MNEELKQQMLKDLEQFRSKNTPQKSSIQADLENFRKSKTTPQTPEQIHIQGLKERREASNAEFNKKQEELKQGGGVGKTMAFFRDLGRGIENQATRQGGNLLTFGASLVKGAGVDESRIPVWLRSGGEANEYATGKALEGQNLTQKVGAFGFGAASALAPTPFGKVGLTGKAGTFAKSLAEGVQGDVMLSGDISPLTLGLATGNLGYNALKETSKAKKMLSEAYNLKSSGKVDEGELAHQKYLSQIGLNTPEKIAAVKKQEMEKFDDLLKTSSLKTSKQLDLINMPQEAKEIALSNYVFKRNPQNGKLDLTSSLQNIRDEKEATYDKILELGDLLNKPGFVPESLLSISADSPLMRRITQTIADKKIGSESGAEFTGEADKMLEKVYEILQPSKRNKVTFDELNKIRRKANQSNDVEMKDAVTIITDAFRQQMDLEIDKLDSSLFNGYGGAENVTLVQALEAFKNLNKQYGYLKDAEKLTDALSSSKMESSGSFEKMIGGIIATGGTYNPIGYAIGSKAADKIIGVINDLKAMDLGATSGGFRVKSKLSPNILEKLKTVPKKKGVDTKLREEAGLQ